MPKKSGHPVKISGVKRGLLWSFELAVLVVLLWLLYVYTGQALCKIAIGQMAELTNTKIKTKSVVFNSNGSVFIEQLVVKPHKSQPYDDSILKAERVSARFSIGSLLLLRPRLKEINLENFVFDAQCDLDTGRWNIAALKMSAPKGKTAKMPVILLENGLLEYTKISEGHAKVIAAIPIDVKFGPADKDEEKTEQKQLLPVEITEDCYRFQVTTAGWSRFGKSTLRGFWRPGEVIITGGISSTNVPTLEKSWTINILAAVLNYRQDNSFSLKFRIRDLINKQKKQVETLEPETPLFLKKFKAFAALQKFYRRYRPLGKADIELDVIGNFDDLGAASVQGKVSCKDIQIYDRKFPYKVENLTGVIELTENSASLNNLVGKHGNVELFLSGYSRDFGPDRQYQLHITSSNMILDSDLYKALNPKQKEIWSYFSPEGMAAINYSLFLHPQTGKRMTLSAELLDVNAAYHYFPYPLKNLRGTLLFDRDDIIVSDVVSHVEDEQITLNGRIQPGKEDQQLRYHLSVQAQQLQLSDKLFGLLSSPFKEAVRQLQMQGKVNLTADITEPEKGDAPDVKIALECLGNSATLGFFPYPLKNIRGHLTITKDDIQLRNITANAAGSIRIISESPTVKVNGRIDLTDNAMGNAQFAISANDIVLDEQLRAALPEGIGSLYHAVAPTGRIDLDLKNISISNKDKGQKYTDFEGSVKFKDCSFNTSPAITQVQAVVKEFKGSYKNGQGLQNARIDLAAENLRIKDKRITNLTADINYDKQLRKWVTKGLIANCYNGRLTGKFEFGRSADNTFEYLLRTGFEGIDLRQFLQKPGHSSKQQDNSYSHSTGTMSGSISLAAVVDNSYSRIGRCKLLISDMRVGKASPLAKLLEVLKLSAPKDFIFDQMFVDSYINHNKMLFECFDLSGPAAAFVGTGSLDLQNSELDLTLTARGRRPATAEPSVLRSLTESLSYAVVRMKVGGTLNDPQITTKTLPVFKDSMKILGTRPTKSH